MPNKYPRGSKWLLFVAALLLAAAPSLSASVNTDRKGVAIEGYDPVAYFTPGGPTKGSESITASHDGATYRFASEKNREAFVAEPQRYLPQYGGFCSYAVSLGKKVEIDPEAWDIVDDRLYLNYSASIRKKWRKDIPGYIERADAKWPELAGND